MSEMKYFNVGFFKKFFYKKDPKKILEAFNLRDWVITSEEIVSELSTLEEFVSLPGYSDVRLVGKIGETMIFKVKDLENVIYTGGKDSITAVFNRNLFDEEMGIEIEYLIQTNKDLTKIMVH
jgi:PleD family two-component response regulator